MARLDKSIRKKLAELLREQLPHHWMVKVGVSGHAYLEVDQDGMRPDSEFPTLGTTVIVIENDPEEGCVVAEVFKRVKCPPGYTEGREHEGTLAVVSGRGWKELLADTISTFAVELDAHLMASEVGEA
jgi:hypothetical protein